MLATAELGRDLRYVQGALLIAILGLLGYYQIPAGRNLRGLIWGYGLFIGTSVINVAIRSQRGNEFSLLMQKLQPLVYDVALIIWAAALWSNQPEPQPDAGVEMERNYQVLAAQTKMLLARAFAHVVRSMRV